MPTFRGGCTIHSSCARAVENLTDKQPPLYYGPPVQMKQPILPPTDVLGRRYFLRANMKF